MPAADGAKTDEDEDETHGVDEYVWACAMGLLGAAAKLRMLMGSQDATTEALKSLRSMVLDHYDAGDITRASAGISLWEQALKGTRVTTDPRSLTLRSWLRLTRGPSEGNLSLFRLKRLSQFEQLLKAVGLHTQEVERRHGYAVKAAGKVSTFGESFLSLAQGGWVFSLARKNRKINEKIYQGVTELTQLLEGLEEADNEKGPEDEDVDMRGAHSHFLHVKGLEGGETYSVQKQAHNEWMSFTPARKEEYRVEAIAHLRAEKRERANSKLRSLKTKAKRDMETVEIEKSVWSEIEREVKNEYRKGAETCVREKTTGNRRKYEQEYKQLLTPGLRIQSESISLKIDRIRFNATKRTVCVVNVAHAMDLFRTAAQKQTVGYRDSRAPERKTDPTKQGLKLLERAYPTSTLDGLTLDYLAEANNILVLCHDPDENCLPDLTVATGRSINENSPSSHVCMVVFIQKSPKRYISIELIGTTRPSEFCMDRITASGELKFFDSEDEVRSNSSDAVATYIARPIRLPNQSLQGGFRIKRLQKVGMVGSGELKVDIEVKDSVEKRAQPLGTQKADAATQAISSRAMNTIAISSDISKLRVFELLFRFGFRFTRVL